MVRNQPLVSIIMPTYNSEKYIAEAIQSVLIQTYKNFELIIIDDGSNDSTKEIIYSFDDKRIKYIYQGNQGVSVARNQGIKLAKGKYITFLDADDTLPFDSFEKKVNYLEANKMIDMVHGIIVISNENLQKEFQRLKTFSYDNLKKMILHLDQKLSFNIGYMIRLDKAINIRFNEEMTHSEDILFLLELCVKNLKYGFIDEPMYYYRVTETSAMSNMKGWRKGYLDLLNYINKISVISYSDTLVMRFKILRMLMSWHLKEKNLLGFFDIFKIFKIGDIK